MEHLEGSSIGQAPVLPTNIRLSWKGLPGTNTLSYYEHSRKFGRKKFYNIGPNVINLLTAVSYDFS